MKEMIKTHYEPLQQLLDCIKTGVFITDKQGRILMANRKSELFREKATPFIGELSPDRKAGYSAAPLLQDGELELIVFTKHLIEKNRPGDLFLGQKTPAGGQSGFIMESLEMKRVAKLVLRIAKLDTTVFLKGESGTGKEMVANLLHTNSSRKDKPFIKINCGAIPEKLLESELFGYERGAFTGADQRGKAGMFELADRGTLFLDEIGELPLNMQSKLLRVLQEKEVMRLGGNKVIPINVRIITASNVNMKAAIERGSFREDLYYRLNILPIEIPALRNRKGDIGKLAVFFLEGFNRAYGLNKYLNQEALRVLECYSWPGNVRELRNMIERVAISFDGSEVTRFHITSTLASGEENHRLLDGKPVDTLANMLEQYEKKLLSDLIFRYPNGSEVARLLGINKSTVSRKLKKYGIVKRRTMEDEGL